MHPVRLSLVTCNIWNTERWPERAGALGHFLALFDPDVLCLQELAPETQRFLDERLPLHERVHDALPGWSVESNIYWRKSLFKKLEHGAEDVIHFEKHRRLFWARLRLHGTDRTVFVSTAHLTAPGEEPEISTGASPRVAQLQRIRASLGALVKPSEPAFFMGDMNDARHPQRLLREAGYVSCFAALGMQGPPTFKCYPTANVKAGATAISEHIDIIVANAAAKAVAACVPQVFFNDLAPSDHWPVQAVYEI